MFNLSPIYSARKSSNHKLSINHKLRPDTNLHNIKHTQTSNTIFLQTGTMWCCQAQSWWSNKSIQIPVIASWGQPDHSVSAVLEKRALSTTSLCLLGPHPLSQNSFRPPPPSTPSQWYPRPRSFCMPASILMTERRYHQRLQLFRDS